MFGPLKQRSSWFSSIATSLIGWNGFFIIMALALGYVVPASSLFLMGSVAALLQVIVLRSAFFLLRMNKSLSIGFFWGTVTGGLIVLIEASFSRMIQDHILIWVLNGAYIGFAVGGFLSYFYRDDQRIKNTSSSIMNKDMDYGRDAHWLEPFLFGAISYWLVFLPRSIDLAVYIAIVGAMSGVVAAGTSHFSPDSWKQSFWIFPAILLAGSLQGLITGLLFRQYADSLLLPHLLAGAAAGGLTYLMTFLRGRTLSRRENKKLSSQRKEKIKV
jgi:hypothetical protein